MSSKTLIVAQREYLENLRTKTFWIGIFSLPVIFALFIFVGRILQESKDVRTYAVLDRSDWLKAAIDRRIATSDLGALLKAGVGESGEEQAAAEAKVREWWESLPADHALRDLVRRIAPLVEGFDEQAFVAEGLSITDLPPAAYREAIRWYFEVQADPEKLEQLQGLAASIAMSKYRRIDPSELGVESEADLEQAEERLNAAVNSGELFAYFVIPPDPLNEGGGQYVSNNLTDNKLRQWLETHATEVVRKRRIDSLSGVSEADARKLLASYEFKERQVDPTTGLATDVGTKEKAEGFAPVVFVYLLWIAVFTAAQMLLTNTVEEKSNRLIEVLLSSVSPLQLMAGKVLGIAATGLTIVIAWVLTAVIGAKLIPESSPLGGADFVAIVGDPLYLTSFIAYFIAGYLLYAAILVALGSVCDSLKEAQNLMQPVFILLIVPLVAMMFVVQDPNGTVARVLTYIPLYTPFLMMNRAGGPPPAWEYVASTALILVSLVIAFWAAGKIFRVGILMTGKPPRIREILHWLRVPIGAIHVPTVSQDPDAPPS